MSKQPVPRITNGHGNQPRRVVVLAARWWGDGEEEWLTRQVAGAWLGQAEVDVFTLQGTEATSTDSQATPANAAGLSCTVHPLGLAPDPQTSAWREVLLTALTSVAAVTGEPGSRAAERLLSSGAAETWAVADDPVAAVSPDLVVVVGYRNFGAFEVWQRVAPGTPLVFVPLADNDDVSTLQYVELILDEAAVTLVVTEPEYQAVIGPSRPARRRRAGVVKIGLPAFDDHVTANDPTDPDNRSGVVIFTGSSSDLPGGRGEWARLVALAYPGTEVTVLGAETLDVWWRGISTRSPAPTDESAIVRLMAEAAVTVHLHPGDLVARWCVDSLRAGTPVVVPAGSPARQLVEWGAAGLWYSSPGELVWCVGAMLDPAVARKFGAQGKQYVDAEYGSTAEFVDRIQTAVGDLVLTDR